MLLSQVIWPSDVTLVSAFHMKGNFLADFPAILPSQVIVHPGHVIAVSVVAVVRIRYNKTIVVRGAYSPYIGCRLH